MTTQIHTDALLLNLCDDLKRVIDRIDGEPETPDAGAQDEIHCALFDETANLRDQIADTPATTLTGLWAKFRVVSSICEEEAHASYGAELWDSFAHDIERMSEAGHKRGPGT